MKRLFDPHCYDLASLFLDDVKGATEAQRNDLASTIQQAIEDWLEDQDDGGDVAYDSYVESKLEEWRETGIRPAFLKRKVGRVNE